MCTHLLLFFLLLLWHVALHGNNLLVLFSSTCISATVFLVSFWVARGCFAHFWFRYPEYDIIVTGHSLGAAVCTLYGVAIRSSKQPPTTSSNLPNIEYPSMKIRVYALACPPVFPLNFSRQVSHILQNLVNNFRFRTL